MDNTKNNHWIDVKQQMPETGLKVKVRMVFEFDDTGVWDGKNWVGEDGKFKGCQDEVTHWTLTIC